MKRVLFVATVDTHILAFHLPYLKHFRDNGFEVHVASNGNLEIPYVDKKINVPFNRSPFSFDNINAYKILKKNIDEYNYEIIHCHTPVGGALTRLAAQSARRNGSKVIYTAHGFHFYKGASLKNWSIFYPLELILSRVTDCLITMNNEDYQSAVIGSFKAKRIEKVNGVGVDLDRFSAIDFEMMQRLRIKHEINKDAFIGIYTAELCHRKNHEYLIKAVSKIKGNIPNFVLLLPGEGSLRSQCEALAKENGIGHMLKFLGFRKDINELAALSDVVVSTSRQEGLPVNLLEGMAAGKPIVATDIRGHNDLVDEGTNGFLCPLGDYSRLSKNILKLYNNRELCLKMGQNNLKRVEEYSLDKVKAEMVKIYNSYL